MKFITTKSKQFVALAAISFVMSTAYAEITSLNEQNSSESTTSERTTAVEGRYAPVFLPFSKEGDDNTSTKQYVVGFGNKQFTMNYCVDAPEGEAVHRYMSNLLFCDEKSNINDALQSFLDSWKPEAVGVGVGKSERGTINITIEKMWNNDRLATYHATASMLHCDYPDGYSQAAEKKRNQFRIFRKGIDICFIVDLESHEILTVDQILQPSVAQKIKSIFGKDVSLYAEDRFILFSKKGGGEANLLFSAVTEPHFTDRFKHLVGWGTQNNDIPTFIHGRKGLEKFFTDKHLQLLTDDNEVVKDSIVMSVLIDDDGTPLQARVKKAPAYGGEGNVLDLCDKMPKWIPAFADGKPIAKEAVFTLKTSDSFLKVFDVVEKMPTFPGGDAALIEYLRQNIKYPKEAEENGIQGSVICNVIVEIDGSLSNIKVIKRSLHPLLDKLHPLLDKEAVRVLKQMPKWNPGLQNGNPCRVKYTIPVFFRLR